MIKVLEGLEKKNLILNADKCTFRMTKIVLMWVLLTKHGIGPTEDKVKAIVESCKPQPFSEVRSFLGLVGFSVRFIPEFGTVADPLRVIVRKGEPCVWGQEEENCFLKVKQQIASTPVLHNLTRKLTRG